MAGPKAASRTALFAAVAVWLRAVPTNERRDYLRKQLGVDLSPATILNAPRDSERVLGDQLPAVRQADADALQVFSAAVRIRPKSRSSGAFEAVRAIPGVTEVLRLRERGDLIAIVVYETPDSMRLLEGQLAVHGVIDEWAQIDVHDHTPAAATWEELARAAAAEEDFAV